MGCCSSHRRKQTEDVTDQKWDHINLNDFKAKGCGTGFAYFYLWLMLVISVLVYAVDSFTAVNLLAFNRWSSQIQPAIPLNISKWIFSVCIILSFVNLAYEAFRAVRVIRRGNVAESYLDPLAVRWQSIRVGSGQGWRRFLVFAELTKSKKGGEYIALFTYFSLKTWIRVLICSAPRQVVNTFTLKSVYQAKLEVSSDSVGGSLSLFFGKIKALADEDYQQALILGSMCFTLVIFVFSFLFLVAAILFYVFFLFHWLPRADGGLSGYCERKVNKALLKIVTKKVNKALAKKEADRIRAEYKAAKRNGEKLPLERMATLPDIGDVKADSLPSMPELARSETMSTLPAYSPGPGAGGSIELGTMDLKRPMASRGDTTTSTTSYSSRAPLMDSAAEMGYGGPEPTLPNLDLSSLPPSRPGTSASQRSFGSRPGMAHLNTNSNSSLRNPITSSPAPMTPDSAGPFASPARPPMNRAMDSSRPPYGQGQGSFNRPAPQQRSYEAYRPDGRSSPAPSGDGYRNGPPPPRQAGPPQPPYQATRSATGPVPPRGPGYPPQRNMTAPIDPRAPPAGGYFDRPVPAQAPRRPAPPQDYSYSGTSQGRQGTPYGYDVEGQPDRRF